MVGEREASAFRPGTSDAPKLFALPTPDFSHEDSTDGAQRSGVAGQEQAQFKGNAQHPLADGNVWEDSVCEMCGRAAHAARVARRADASQLARKRHEYFLVTRGTPSAQKAVRVDAASKVGAQLAFDVARYTAVVRGASLGQKRLEVSRDQPVKWSRLRAALFVA